MSGAQAYDSREEWRHFDFAHLAAPAAWRTVSALETMGMVAFEVPRYEAALQLLRKHAALADDDRTREVLRRSGLLGQVPRFVRVPAAIADALETCEEPAVSGKWVPARALEAAVECLKADMSFAKERRLARVLYAREGALESWRAAKRLGGKDALRGLALALLAEDEVGDGLCAT